MADKSTKRYVLYDTLTGAVVQEFSLLPSSKCAKGKGYFMLWNDIIYDERVSKADCLLFLHLCAIMEPGGWIPETQASIAKQIKSDTSNTSKAIKRLRDLGYLLNSEHRGSIWLQVNPEYAHKGPLLYRKIPEEHN